VNSAQIKTGTGISLQMMCNSGNIARHVKILTICQTGKNMLNLIRAINEMWARAHKPELKTTVLQIMLSTATIKTKVSAKAIPHEADAHSGT
jgi:hypothetical protein